MDPLRGGSRSWSLWLWSLAIRSNTALLKAGAGGGGRGGETKSGTEKRCSHNLQSGHSAWWSADNYILLQEIFLDFLEARSEPAEEIRNA